MIFWKPPHHRLSAVNITQLDVFRNLNMHGSAIFCGVQIPSLSAYNCQLISVQVILTRTDRGRYRSCVVFDPEADMFYGTCTPRLGFISHVKGTVIVSP